MAGGPAPTAELSAGAGRQEGGEGGKRGGFYDGGWPGTTAGLSAGAGRREGGEGGRGGLLRWRGARHHGGAQRRSQTAGGRKGGEGGHLRCRGARHHGGAQRRSRTAGGRGGGRGGIYDSGGPGTTAGLSSRMNRVEKDQAGCLNLAKLETKSSTPRFQVISDMKGQLTRFRPVMSTYVKVSPLTCPRQGIPDTDESFH